jgi:iron complex outermembrane receptor protein
MRMCTDTAFNPDLDVNCPFCEYFKRDSRGVIGPLQRTFFNNGRFKTSGIDLLFNWSKYMGPGRVGVDMLVNYLIDKKSSELDVLPLVDYTGTFGPTENGLNGNSYEWKFLTTLSYTFNDPGLYLGLRWQRLDSIEQTSSLYGPTPVTGAPTYDMFDLLGSYQLMDNMMLRFGIENVFNKEPPLIGVNTAATDGMTGGMFNAQNYDTNGRRFYLGARVNF